MNLVRIDTSNYTTFSLRFTMPASMIRWQSVCSRKGRRSGGRCGKRRVSHHHVQQLPELMDKLWKPGCGKALSAVGVSARPRDAEGSYMPCFTVGLTYARLLSTALEVPFYTFSHQAGHIAAALYPEAFAF
ncbi:MAG: hypothetical protein ACLT1K_02295 [[Clostridium] leptum]